jgi:hypothetical protein
MGSSTGGGVDDEAADWKRAIVLIDFELLCADVVAIRAVAIEGVRPHHVRSILMGSLLWYRRYIEDRGRID